MTILYLLVLHAALLATLCMTILYSYPMDIFFIYIDTASGRSVAQSPAAPPSANVPATVCKYDLRRKASSLTDAAENATTATTAAAAVAAAVASATDPTPGCSDEPPPAKRVKKTRPTSSTAVKNISML